MKRKSDVIKKMDNCNAEHSGEPAASNENGGPKPATCKTDAEDVAYQSS